MTWKHYLCAAAAAALVSTSLALEVEKDNQVSKQFLDTENEQGNGKLYFTGTGYTINLIPQAIILGIISFIAAFLFGLFKTGDSVETGYGAPSAGYGAPAVGYGAPEPSYGAPEASYGAPEASYAAPASSYSAPSSGYSAAGRYYDTYAAAAADSAGFEDRRKRSAF